MNLKLQIQVLSIFLLVGFSFYLFEAQFINTKILNYSVLAILSGAILLSVPYCFIRNEGFVLPVKLIVLSILVSMLMANITWQQSFKDSLIETIPFLLWIFFFYLLHIKVPVRVIENIVLIYGAIYVLLYFYQLANAGTLIFGRPMSGTEHPEQRGIVRIIFPGAGVFILSVFISLNRLTGGAKGRLLWILFLVLGIVIPVLQVTRQFIAGMLLVYVFHFVKDKPLLYKLIIAGLFLAMVVFIGTTDTPMIKGVIEVQERDAHLGENYIRVLAGIYYLTDFSPGVMNVLLGNGAPNWGVSQYGIYVEGLANKHEYFMSDVGIIGMYAMFGLMSVLGYVLIWGKSFTISLPKGYYYLKYYLWYLLFTSLTWYSVYHYSYLISTVFVLYIYHMVYVHQRKLKILKHPERSSSLQTLSET